MLVMSRTAGQSLCIGDVRVSVVGPEGGKVRLGVSTPVGVPVWRAEVKPDHLPQAPVPARHAEKKAERPRRAGRKNRRAAHRLAWRLTEQAAYLLGLAVIGWFIKLLFGR